MDNKPKIAVEAGVCIACLGKNNDRFILKSSTPDGDSAMLVIRPPTKR